MKNAVRRVPIKKRRLPKLKVAVPVVIPLPSEELVVIPIALPARGWRATLNSILKFIQGD